MMKQADRQLAEDRAARLIQTFTNRDVRSDEGLKGTPRRMVKMLEEMLAYENVSNADIADQNNVVFEDDLIGSTQSVVKVKDIKSFSLCEHHVALMYNMYVDVYYKPVNGKVIGLSKINRVVHSVCARLQLQEKIGNDILDVMNKITGSNNITVIVRSEHSCVSARGIKSNSHTETKHILGEEIPYE